MIIEDGTRERRLEEGEEEKIREIIGSDDEWQLLFTLALETAMRLSEIYTLTSDQVDIPKRTIFLDKTKNGHKRQVPLSSVAIIALKNIPKKGQVFKSFVAIGASLRCACRDNSLYLQRRPVARGSSSMIYVMKQHVVYLNAQAFQTCKSP